jgi:ribosomal protein L17
MRHRVGGRKLQRTSAHRLALFRNMSAALIKHEQILTTVAKAKELRPYVEKLVTLAKKGGLSNRRLAHMPVCWTMRMLVKLFDVLAVRYARIAPAATPASSRPASAPLTLRRWPSSNSLIATRLCQGPG